MIKIFKKGFTLIELLVVIAIIGILITVGSVSYIRAMELSRDSKRKTDLEQIRQALETYRSEIGTYPASKDLKDSLVSNYITTLPTDPKPPATYAYTPNTTTTYTLCATLEIPPSAASGCALPGNYKVTNP
ncbi:MAG: prepilin-type N-terminal cleavage/methylation domain-containing protein [bacterium]